MRKAIFLACATLFISAQTPPDPIMTHYRAYRAAVEAGDLGSAEIEARAAWDASVARDGDGGRSGVLALNLARVSLTNQHREAAYAPAMQAFNIAMNNPNSGLDPLVTQFVLGRAELTSEREDEGSARLLRALEESRSRAELAADSHETAADLGHWALREEEFETAVVAWSHAAAHAGSSSGDHTLALGQARTAEGIAWIAIAANAEVRQARRGSGLTGSILSAADEVESYQRAQAALLEAERTLLPMAWRQGQGNGLTFAQRDYALARAWRAVIDARRRSHDQNVLSSGSVRALIDMPPGAGPLCAVDIIGEPEPRYPRAALVRHGFGAAVVRITHDSSGAAVDAQVAAAVPDSEFRSVLEEVIPRWRSRRREGSPADCYVPPISFYVMTFYLQ